MSRPVRGIVVAHGDVAAALVRATERITGVSGALAAVSNEGLGAEQLRRELRDACGSAPTVVFADLAGGSCAMAGLGLRGSESGVAVLTGVNLPMLVDFVFHRDLPLERIVERLAEKGRAGIRSAMCEGTPDPAGA